MRYFTDTKIEIKHTIHRITRDLRSLNMKLFVPILFIGILFRIIAFSTHTSFHTDEALYAKWAASIGHNYNIGFTISEVDKPPLFYYLLGTSIFLFGPTDYAAKIPGMLFGILMIPLVTLIALNLGKQKAALWRPFFIHCHHLRFYTLQLCSLIQHVFFSVYLFYFL